MACSRRYSRDDRGATLVELAIVGLLVFTLILAMFEFGLLFRDNLTATDAVGDAARIGAIVGPDVDSVGNNADYAIVRSVREGLASLDGADVRYIVIFKASGSNEPAIDQVPAACRNGTSIPDVCNAYPADAAFAAVVGGQADYFNCPAPPDPAKIACRWDAKTRSDGPLPSQVDTVGVYVDIDKDGYTGLFADRWSIDRAAAIRLEPGVSTP